MSFGSVIRERRTALGIGLNDFAERLEISAAYWSRIERGMERAPKDELIIAACQKLGLDTDQGFVEARRLPPDVQDDIATAVRAYRAFKTVSRG